MRSHRTTHFPRRAVCGWCRGPIDFSGDYWTDSGEVLEDKIAVGIVHPDCLFHFIYKGPVPMGARIEHTCGEALCVNPDHLVLHAAGG